MALPLLPVLGLTARALAGSSIGAGEAVLGARAAAALSNLSDSSIDTSQIENAARAAASGVPEIRLSFDATVPSMFMRGIQRQLRWAATRTLNDTAFAVRAAEQSAMHRQIDRPTPFTVAGIQVQKTRPETLRARVFIEEKRWKYMQYQVDGGVRRKRAKALMIGVTERNQYGNIPGWAKKWSFYLRKYGKANLRSGKIGGLAGLWVKKKRLSNNAGSLSRQSNVASRKGARWELLILYEDSVSYRARFFFYRNAEPVINRFMQMAWRAHLQAAIENAKVK